MKRKLFALLHAAGLTRFAAWWNRNRVIILCYHGVTERETRGPRDPHGIHVPRRLFEAQLDYLRRRHHVISLRDYLAARRAGRKLPAYSVVLTFDDGFRNFLTVAAPCLASRGLPASLFIITNKTDEGGDPGAGQRWTPADDWTYLSWAEVAELARDGRVEIGSHTCSHTRLPTLSPEETEREMRDSYEAVVARLSHENPALSYPKGEYSEVLALLARATGYVCAVTADGGANDPARTDPFAIGRTLIGDRDDIAAFAVRVSGVRDWLAQAGALFPPRSAAPTLRRAGELPLSAESAENV